MTNKDESPTVLLIIAVGSETAARAIRDASRRNFPRQIRWTAIDRCLVGDYLAGRLPPNGVYDVDCPKRLTLADLEGNDNDRPF